MRIERNEIERRLRERIRMQGKARSTADNYWHWFNRYLKFCRTELAGQGLEAEKAVERFLTFLANRLHVSANTQNQAFSALCYVYRDLFNRPLVGVSALRAKRPDRVRDVCSRSELREIFSRLSGVNLLACRMIYASGFRIGELASLRIKDLKFDQKQIHVFDAKGSKDRIVQFPEVLHESVRQQVESVKRIWQSDVKAKRNGVSLPFAWGRKSPSSRLDFAWWYFLPSDTYSRCPETGCSYRHHRDTSGISKALKDAVRESGIPKRITLHSIRHAFATHSLESGVTIHDLAELMGHGSIETTETYLHARENGVTSAPSPLSAMEIPDRSDSATAIGKLMLELLANPDLAAQYRDQPRLRLKQA